MTESKVHASQEHTHTAHDDSHGHSTAAWTGVIIMLVATAIICLGMVLAQPIMWIGGTILFIAGAIAWPVMNKAGYGTGGPKNRMEH